MFQIVDTCYVAGGKHSLDGVQAAEWWLCNKLNPVHSIAAPEWRLQGGHTGCV